MLQMSVKQHDLLTASLSTVNRSRILESALRARLRSLLLQHNSSLLI